MEAEGVITDVEWRNPHIMFTLTMADGTELNLETHSLSIMRRLGATEPFIQVGDRAKVAGWPSRTDQRIFVNNMLLPNGEEFVFKFQREPADLLWSDRMFGTTETWFAEVGDAPSDGQGIFRVWSTTLSGGLQFLALPEYPLTAEAQAIAARFNPVTDDPSLNCSPKGMPIIMSAPYPIEFQDRGDRILLRLEEFDTLRTIYMDPQTTPVSTPSILGRSTGTWDGETLVAVTSNVNWGHLNTNGVPLSEQAEFVERFTPTDRGARLIYEITVTDPKTFTEPIVLSKSWVWLPNARVEPYDCNRNDLP